ncbi:SDR family oxidoreductase [Asanoa iriomotensis]|uniref:NAD(P)-dependent oxidoreductase n=1 Tax=Asanoa iriomotensis TaxID=234613 RepID=A0ABQ4C108_9ACTN|nr:SDR family oxidoreductase [Asanoa iriomotensis]GIF56466.1 NAD(P)-dependent oxidoreductase [Asanoa iriomotensis]
MIVVTGASGELGRMVIDELLLRVPAGQVVAAARSPEKLNDLVDRGIDVRPADYDRPMTLRDAFDGADRVLLISGPVPGARLRQHRAVVDAARATGASFIAYTSVAHADDTPIPVPDHERTERYIAESGLPYGFLRNNWYSEVYIPVARRAAMTGEVLGASGAGRIASAPRADYAAAAASVLAGDGHDNSVYELAGDSAFTKAELADLVSDLSGEPVTYRNLTTADYRDALVAQDVPEPDAEFTARVDEGIAAGGLADTPGTLARLIGHPTTPLAVTLAPAVRGI